MIISLWDGSEVRNPVRRRDLSPDEPGRPPRPHFEDDQDRQRFLETLGQACENTYWQVHAYCLMSNHFHLVIETPQPNPAEGAPTF